MVRVTTQMEDGESSPRSPSPPMEQWEIVPEDQIFTDDDEPMTQNTASQREDEYDLLFDSESETEEETVAEENVEAEEMQKEFAKFGDFNFVHIYGGNEEMDAKMQEIRDANQDDEKGLVIIRHPVKPEPPPELVFPDDVFDNQIESAKEIFEYFEVDKESKEKKLLNAFAFGPTQVNLFS